MIVNRTGDMPEHPTLPILSEQPRSSEPRLDDRVMWAWITEEPVAETAAERMEADRRSVSREIVRAFS